MPPASSDEKTKQIQIARPTFMLNLTVWGVPPASSDKKVIIIILTKIQIVRSTSVIHLTVWGVPPATSDEKKKKTTNS